MSNKNRQRNFAYTKPQGETVVPELENEVTEQPVDSLEQSEVTAPEEVTSASVVTKETPVVEQKVQQKQTTQQEGFKPVFKVELELSNYAEAMSKNKPINPEEGGKWQNSLYLFMKSLLNTASQEEFNKEWSTLLNFFNKNKDGIFNETYMFRFPEHWTGSPNEYSTFRRLVYLAIQSADPKARRKVTEHINMQTVGEGLSETQKQRLFSYYNV